jgi:cytochrome c-type biogenesis protein CcmH/NrfF
MTYLLLWSVPVLALCMAVFEFRRKAREGRG